MRTGFIIVTKEHNKNLRIFQLCLETNLLLSCPKFWINVSFSNEWWSISRLGAYLTSKTLMDIFTKSFLIVFISHFILITSNKKIFARTDTMIDWPGLSRTSEKQESRRIFWTLYCDKVKYNPELLVTFYQVRLVMIIHQWSLIRLLPTVWLSSCSCLLPWQGLTFISALDNLLQPQSIRTALLSLITWEIFNRTSYTQYFSKFFSLWNIYPWYLYLPRLVGKHLMSHFRILFLFSKIIWSWKCFYCRLL